VDFPDQHLGSLKMSPMQSQADDENDESESGNPMPMIKDLGFAWLNMFVHLFTALIVCVYMGRVVPRFSKYYDDMGIELSSTVVRTIQLSRFVAPHWYLFLFASAWVGGGNALALRGLPKNLRWIQMLWLIAWPVTAIVLTLLNAVLLYLAANWRSGD
jgi:hypothetical protein